MWASIVGFLAGFIEKIGVAVVIDLTSRLGQWLMSFWQKREEKQENKQEAQDYDKTMADPTKTLEEKNAAEDKLLNS